MADLQGRALDAAVAVYVMGWKFTGGTYHEDTTVPFRAAGICREYGMDAPEGRVVDMSRVNREHGAPRYSTSHDAVALVRAEIERRGMERQFLSEMIAIVGYTEWTAWRSMNASPEQQCWAALAAVEGAR